MKLLPATQRHRRANGPEKLPRWLNDTVHVVEVGGELDETQG